jgi:hypothetical protein
MKQAVKLVSAHLVGLPPHMEAVGSMVAVKPSQTGGSVGALWGNLTDGWRKQGKLHQVSDVTIAPGGVSDWDLVATVKSLVPGTYRTRGIEVTYRVGSKTLSQFFPFRILLVIEK